jgi:hypothetical protein
LICSYLIDSCGLATLVLVPERYDFQYLDSEIQSRIAVMIYRDKRQQPLRGRRLSPPSQYSSNQQNAHAHSVRQVMMSARTPATKRDSPFPREDPVERNPIDAVRESQWLLKLHTHGLVNNSFQPIFEIRVLTNQLS